MNLVNIYFLSLIAYLGLMATVTTTKNFLSFLLFRLIPFTGAIIGVIYLVGPVKSIGGFSF